MLAVLTSFAGGRLFGQVYGSGSPRVLALHGWRRDHSDFVATLTGEPVAAPGGRLARLADDADLPGRPLDSIALDLPGFGSAPEPDGPWGSDRYAEEVGRILSEMEAPVVVLGHSFGGRVAVKLAALEQQRVGGVLLTGTPLFPANPGRSKPPLRLRMARRLARSGIVGQERLEALRRQYGSEDYRTASERMRGVLVQALREEREGGYGEALRSISCPVELVWGELDTAAPPRVAEQIASCLRGPVNLVVRSGVGHLTPFLIPGELRAGIDRLLG